jgi:hypothetical protein
MHPRAPLLNPPTPGSARLTGRLLLPAALGVLLAGCAPAPFERAHLDPDTSGCLARLEAFDAAVDAAGLASADLRRIPGFPALRSDRFRASFRDEIEAAPLDNPRLAAWFEHLAALGRQARAVEAARLQSLAAATPLPALDALEDCASRVTDWDRRQPAAIRRLFANVSVADDYRWSARLLGLYLPGGAWVYARDAADRSRDLYAAFGDTAAAASVTLARLAPGPIAPDALEGLVPAGLLLPTPSGPALAPKVTRMPPAPVFAPPLVGAPRMSEEEYQARFGYRPSSLGLVRNGPVAATGATAVNIPMARVIEAVEGAAPPLAPSRFPLPRDVLGIPRPDPATLAALFQEHAPVLTLVTGASGLTGPARGLPGAIVPSANGATTPFRIDSSRPTLYVRHALTRAGSRSLLQLEYTAWLGGDDGALDGIIWRVTLDDDGSVLLADAIPACGCWHLAFPGPRLAPRRARLEPIDPITQPAGLPAGEGRLEVLLAADTLAIVALRRAVPAEGTDGPGRQDTTPPTAYTLRPARELATAVSHAGLAFFGPDGIVPGTARDERWWLWTSGVRAGGSPRQWSRQTTAFAGERHFDDADLIERHFLPLGGALAWP